MLLIGIGNTGRGDDGLGWLFAETIEKKYPGIFDIEYRYQLQIEDALLVTNYPIVIFADATREAPENGYYLKKIAGANHYFYSSHMQSPETVLYLAETLYNHTPEAYVMGIAGRSWELGDFLSDTAADNLENALSHFAQSLPVSVKKPPAVPEKDA